MNKNEKGKLFRKSLAGFMLAGAVLTGAMNNNNTYGANISQAQEDNLIELPEGFGRIKSFQAWDYPCGNVESHWDYLSKQYEFWKKANGLNSYDEKGFGVVNGSYVVAVTDKYGDIGDFILVELEDGTTIPCVIGDLKNKNDEGCNEYGHIDGYNVLEFMGKTSEWYNKDYGDIAKALKPEWYDKAVDSVLKTNVNYLENPEYVIPVDEYEKIFDENER